MNAEPIYYTPRDTFDPAVIEVKDGLVFYSRSKLMSILVEEYVSNLEALTQYRGSPVHILSDSPSDRRSSG